MLLPRQKRESDGVISLKKVKMFVPSITFGVFLSVLCDNLLLTVVVPILPEFLREKASASFDSKISHWQIPNALQKINGSISISTTPPIIASHLQSIPKDSGKVDPGYVGRAKLFTESCFKELFHLQMLDEDSKLGLLFSTKALVQLLCNPLVGKLTIRFGFKLLLSMGNLILFLCALAFGFGDSYILLLFARSFHGLGSALVAISGMALVAELYPVDAERTLYMGRVMGAAALGVLIGYPFGGVVYAIAGKLFPFLVIGMLAFFTSLLCGSTLHLSRQHDPSLEHEISHFGGLKANELLPVAVTDASTCWSLLKDKPIRIIFIALWFSTLAIAALEPTLPVWLIETVDPPKWQLGLVFVPDSIGYFIGTNFFGSLALRVGRWKSSFISVVSIGVACLILPFSRAVWQLSIPHFILGIGLGIVDASLMPLLASFADSRQQANYGTVYALAQTAVALAYSLGPLLAGQLVRLIGFPDLIRSVGLLNLIFSPFILILAEPEQKASTYLQLKLKGERELYHQDLSSSTTCSSIEEVHTTKSFRRQKKVRFHLQMNTEKLPLRAMAAVRSQCIVQPDTYKRFYNDLDSD